jgi:hypothetical protein
MPFSVAANSNFFAALLSLMRDDFPSATPSISGTLRIVEDAMMLDAFSSELVPVSRDGAV